MSAWPGDRGRHGGIDEIPLPNGPGRLWLCGKHFVGPDPALALEKTGAAAIVCLNERHELADRYPHYVQWLDAHAGSAAVWHPIPDLHAPPVAAARALVGEIAGILDAGGGVILHCGAGIGRAGTMAAAVLLHRGVSLADALATVAAHRPMAGPEAGAQSVLLQELAG